MLTTAGTTMAMAPIAIMKPTLMVKVTSGLIAMQ
jgi:hypothetical protein